MDTPLYEEHQSFSLLIGIAIFAALAAVAPFVLAPRAQSNLIASGALAAAMLLLLASFRRLTIVVTAMELRFGFPLIGKRLPLRDVQVGDVLPITFWYGWGIHYIRGMWVWNARLGRGVQIRSGRRTYLLGTEQAERLQSVLREHTHWIPAA